MTETNSNKQTLVLTTPKPKPDGGFKEFLYNPETGAVLGRTGLSWLLIFLFYVVFYIGLAAFFLLNFYLFYLTISQDAPKWTLDASLIGNNPGLGFRPMPDQDNNADSTLIWFKHSDPKDYKFWSNQLTEFVEKIEEIQKEAGGRTHSCTLGTENTTSRNKSCLIDLKQFGPCTKENDFGYSQGKPCFIVKLNKIYGWKPEAYGYRDDRDVFNRERFEKDLQTEKKHKTMPDDLVRHIKAEVDKLDPQRDAALLRRLLETVWISCVGENVADMENTGKKY